MSETGKKKKPEQTEATWSPYTHGNVNKADPSTALFGAEGHEILYMCVALSVSLSVGAERGFLGRFLSVKYNHQGKPQNVNKPETTSQREKN